MMNGILSFLRNLDKRRLIFVLQKLLNGVFPTRLFVECGKGDVCPCPYGREGKVTSVTGIATASECASVRIGNIGGRDTEMSIL